MNYVQRKIQPLNPQIGFNVNSIQRQFQPLNSETGFIVHSIDREIQPLNPQILELKVNSNPRQIKP